MTPYKRLTEAESMDPREDLDLVEDIISKSDGLYDSLLELEFIDLEKDEKFRMKESLSTLENEIKSVLKTL